MFNYRNESAFSNALCKHLRTTGWFVQRIESGTTGKGIPDIFAISPGNIPVWFELKRVCRICPATDVIQWRPGQQAWLHEVTKRGMKAWTLVCYNDRIVAITHDVVYYHNKVGVGRLPSYLYLRNI